MVTARSATGFTVVVAVAELLARLGSNSLAATLAVFVTDGAAAACARTTTVAVAVAPLARVPTLQVIVPPAIEQVPWEPLAETRVKVAGGVSLTVTPVAAFGPLLVTVRL